jgi:hypothetical protein
MDNGVPGYAESKMRQVLVFLGFMSLPSFFGSKSVQTSVPTSGSNVFD